MNFNSKIEDTFGNLLLSKGQVNTQTFLILI